ncbi:carbohydrate-binding protein [uncultured Hymenobacter sp.]|uniref:carbohydrate-binding protein n=1 Tax=uncultured Hymenobacter sp. TaxID=170016 RepID=UPI0035CC5FCF
MPLEVGEYTTQQLEGRYIVNNDVSSIEVSNGYEVQLFDGDNFTGASILINANTDCLVASGWNDRVSSLKVRAAGAAFSTLIQAEAYSAMQGVRVEATSDTGGGQDVGNISAGDFMVYNSIKFPTSGAYTIEYRVASIKGGKLSADLNGSTQLGSVTIPATGGWQTWRTVSQTVNVTADTYAFGIRAQTAGWNLNWIRISKSSTSARGALAAGSPDQPSGLLEVYPNPAVDKLYLTSAAPLRGDQYRILNGWGRLLASGLLTEEPLDVAALPAGVYMLMIVTKGGQTTTRRFMK